MSKLELVKRAILSIGAVVALSACENNASRASADEQIQESNRDEALDEMSPDDKRDAFMDSLSSESKRKFNELDTLHQDRAVNMGGDPNSAVDAQYDDQMGTRDEDTRRDAKTVDKRGAFMDSLSPESKRKFSELDSKHQERAMNMVGDPNKAVDAQLSDQKMTKRLAPKQ